jgi:hypothetical protein
MRIGIMNPQEKEKRPEEEALSFTVCVLKSPDVAFAHRRSRSVQPACMVDKQK